MIYVVTNKSTTLSCWPHSRPYYSFTKLFFYINFALWSFTHGSPCCQLQFSMSPYLYFKIIHTVGNDVSELTWFPWKAFLLHKLTAPPFHNSTAENTATYPLLQYMMMQLTSLLDYLLKMSVTVHVCTCIYILHHVHLQLAVTRQWLSEAITQAL